MNSRAYTPQIDDEMWRSSPTARCSGLGGRCGLGHLLAGYPTLLIKEVNDWPSRDQLHGHFAAAVLPDQPPEIQQAIGVAFGKQQRSGRARTGSRGRRRAAAV